MSNPEERNVQNALRLALDVVEDLATLSRDPNLADALAVRLAQAHANGVVDQLSEVTMTAQSDAQG